jgi:succinate dehydrogenase / fumarate reductase flavoprotein subunit
LLDLLVFGKAAGDHIIANTVAGAAPQDLPANAEDFTLARLARLDNNQNGEYAQDIANDMRTIMQTHAGVFRSQESMDEGVRKIAALRERVGNIGLKDNSKVFNTARIEALEVDNLMEVAQATMESAAARKECRGAHLVRDYEHDVTHPTCPLGRNDAEWMKHTLWYKDGNRLAYKPVRTQPLTAETVPPKPRTF